MPRKLKVYQARVGFHDLVVAAPSQAAALRAWGAHGNMFADGMAFVASDEKAIEAALAQPDVVLKRAVGTNDPFGLNPGLPRLPDAPDAPKNGKVERRPAAAGPPPPDRSALDAAEAALREIEEGAGREAADFKAREDALDAEEETLRGRRAALAGDRSAADGRRKAARLKAEGTLSRERLAYAKAGGKPDARPRAVSPRRGPAPA